MINGIPKCCAIPQKVFVSLYITKLSASAILSVNFKTGFDSNTYCFIITNSILEDTKDLAEISHYGPSNTWFTYFVRQDSGDRIDHILVTSENSKELQHVHIIIEQNFFKKDEC